MALPVLTVADMADFKGREELFFGYFAPKAIELASFLVENVVPAHLIADDDVRGQTLFKYAVLELAFSLYTEQEYADVIINPFTSETIGSYSYSKGQSKEADKFILDPESSSIWMRLLNAYLASLVGEGGSTDISHGGIVGVEYDGAQVDGHGNVVRILGPKRDIEYFDNIYGNEGGYHSSVEGPHY